MTCDRLAFTVTVDRIQCSTPLCNEFFFRAQISTNQEIYFIIISIAWKSVWMLFFSRLLIFSLFFPIFVDSIFKWCGFSVHRKCVVCWTQNEIFMEPWPRLDIYKFNNILPSQLKYMCKTRNIRIRAREKERTTQKSTVNGAA